MSAQRPEKIVLASGNRKKVSELQSLLQAMSIAVLPQSEFNIADADADENGLSFVENAIIKARHAATLSGLPAIADDSGLEVDALQGEPGIYSARFAQNIYQSAEGRDADNNQLLLEKLQNVPKEKRTARFQCVLVYMKHAQDPTPIICQASWSGNILTAPQGENGFGYDPVFFVPSHHCSAAQLNPAEKIRISHRGLAMQKLLAALRELYG